MTPQSCAHRRHTYEGLEKVSRTGNRSMDSTAAARMQISATHESAKHTLQTPSSLPVPTSACLLVVLVTTSKGEVMSNSLEGTIDNDSAPN